MPRKNLRFYGNRNDLLGARRALLDRYPAEVEHVPFPEYVCREARWFIDLEIHENDKLHRAFVAGFLEGRRRGKRGDEEG